MGDYRANFAGRALPAALSPYFARTSNASDESPAGVLSVVSSGVPAFQRNNGLILETARTQLLYNTGFSGAVSGGPGTVPTGWTSIYATGSLTVVSGNGLGSGLRFTSSGGTRRSMAFISVTAAANTTYAASVRFQSHNATLVSGLTYNNIFALQSVPAGATATYFLDGVSFNPSVDMPAGASGVFTIVLAVAGTAGTFRFDIGVNVSGSTNNIDCSFWEPQAEVGAFRSSYIYNTSTVASLARAASFMGDAPFSAIGIASQTQEYSFAAVMRMPFSSSAAAGDGLTFLRMDNAAAGQLQLRINAASASIGVYRFDNGPVFVAAALSSITWTKDQEMLLRWSSGATNGLIMVANSVVSTQTSAGVKAPLATPLTQLRLSYGASFHAIIKAVRFWDRALTQAELAALTAADLGVGAQRAPRIGIGYGIGI